MNLLWLKRLGLPGILGALLCGGAVWVEHEWVPAQLDQASTLESDARRMRHELQQQAAKAAEGASQPQARQADLLKSPKEAWATLWLGLPDGSQRVALQREVLVSAQEAGLDVATVQYRGQMEPWLDKASPQGVWRQRMIMPIEGSYASVRAWLARLLRQPALSLDALDIQRSDVGSDRVKAQVSVSLWWRQDRGR